MIKYFVKEFKWNIRLLNLHFFLCYSEYLQNIKVVDEGIKKTQNLIEKFYKNDKLTSYIFTADHGMTNWGNK